MNTVKNLLTFDSLAGLTVGAIMFAAAPLIVEWYNWSWQFTWYMASANVLYGSYSGILTLLYRKKQALQPGLAWLLIIANGLWGLQCFYQVFRLSDSSTMLGLGLLVFEGIFVGGLAIVEWRKIIPALKD